MPRQNILQANCKRCNAKVPLRPKRDEISFELYEGYLVCPKCRLRIHFAWGSKEIEELEKKIKGMRKSFAKKPRASLEQAIRKNERRLEGRRAYLAAVIAEHEASKSVGTTA